MIEDNENELRGRVEARDDEREYALSGAAVDSSQPGGALRDATGRNLVVRGLAAVGVALWCVSVLAIGVNLAESAWEWAWIFGFGTVVPALFLWQVGRLLTPEEKASLPSARDKEKELLQSLSERGELTPSRLPCGPP